MQRKTQAYIHTYIRKERHTTRQTQHTIRALTTIYTDKMTDTQTDKQDRETDRNTYIHTDREPYRQRQTDNADKTDMADIPYRKDNQGRETYIHTCTHTDSQRSQTYIQTYKHTYIQYI